MKTKTALLLFAVLFSFVGAYAHAPKEAAFVSLHVKPVTRDNYTKQDIKQLIRFYADKYGVSYTSMYATIRNETGGTFDPYIQSRIRYKYISDRWLKLCPGLEVGDRERSYGLAQIHLCSHNVTYKQATDPVFAIEFMAKAFANGKQHWWAAYAEK